MKIMNATPRIVGLDEVIQKTPISEMASTSDLFDDSLIHIAEYVERQGASIIYDSRKMRLGQFKQKMYESVQNTLKTSYLDTHCKKDGGTHELTYEEEGCPEGMSFKELIAYLTENKIAPSEVPESAIDGFVKHIYYDFDVLKRYMVKKDQEIESRLDQIDIDISSIDCFFDSDMTFTTTDESGDITHTSVNHEKTENENYCQMSISEGNKISNVWTVPETGNLVVYGWVDSEKALNNRAIPSSYCVLEARINGQWEIISVQTIIPAKSITYVGFNVLVKKGLEVRVRTGFNVGAKSYQTSNEQDGFDTLANNTANGFKCMIYSMKTSEDQESEGN